MIEKDITERRPLKVWIKIVLVIGIYALTGFIMSLLYNVQAFYTVFHTEPYRSIVIAAWFFLPLVVLLIISFIRNVILERNLTMNQHLLTRIYAAFATNMVLFSPGKSIEERYFASRGTRVLDIGFGKVLYKTVAIAIYILLLDFIAFCLSFALKDIGLSAMLPVVLWVAGISAFVIADVPFMVFVYKKIKEIAIRHHTDKEKKMNSTDLFRLDFTMRRKYLRLPRAIFITDSLVIVLIILALIVFPRDVFSGTSLGFVFAILLVVSLVGWFPAVGYFGICSGRTFTQAIKIKEDKFIYKTYSRSGKWNRETTRYTFSEIFGYRVGSRAIMLRGDGKRLPLWIPRTFTDEAQLLQFFDEHRSAQQ